MDIFAVEDRDGTGKSGTISYTQVTKKVEIDLDIPAARKKKLMSFFTEPREYWIPESDKIDDYRVEPHPPIENTDCFRMAMSELYGATGVYVLW